MRGQPIAVVAGRLGLEVDERGRWISPCPACGRERRNASTPGERRGAISLPSDVSWKCFPCGLGGDAIGLVAASVGREPFSKLGEREKADVRAWCLMFLGDAPATSTSSQPASRSAPRSSSSTTRRAPTRSPSEPREPPPRQHVLDLLNACVPVVDDREVSAYLRSRGVDPVEVNDRLLGVALRVGARLPRWAHFGRLRWDEAGHRLLVPLYDAEGLVRSVVARRVVDGDTPKSLPPAGHTKAGFVMACPFARTILRAGGGMPLLEDEPAAGPWWRPDAPRLRILIAEGDSDFLTFAAGYAHGVRWSEADEYAPAVIGIQSGAWTDAIAARVPDGAELVIGTDADEAGDRYADHIVRTIAARLEAGALTASRWTPERREAA